MEKKSNSFAVVAVSIIALIATAATAVYFVTRWLNKRKQETYDFVDCYNPDEIYDFSDDDDDFCGCVCDCDDCDDCDCDCDDCAEREAEDDK